MVSEILTAAGVNHREVRFLQPPAGTYAVWFDSEDNRGSDSKLCIVDHDCTIELYSKNIDTTTEEKIEEQFRLRVQPYQKDDRRWLKDEQLYMTVYTFEYIEKRR